LNTVTVVATTETVKSAISTGPPKVLSWAMMMSSNAGLRSLGGG
jgi:hypothetical protein